MASRLGTSKETPCVFLAARTRAPKKDRTCMLQLDNKVQKATANVPPETNESLPVDEVCLVTCRVGEYLHLSPRSTVRRF
jgi:hypothetical protein